MYVINISTERRVWTTRGTKERRTKQRVEQASCYCDILNRGRLRLATHLRFQAWRTEPDPRDACDTIERFSHRSVPRNRSSLSTIQRASQPRPERTPPDLQMKNQGSKSIRRHCHRELRTCQAERFYLKLWNNSRTEQKSISIAIPWPIPTRFLGGIVNGTLSDISVIPTFAIISARFFTRKLGRFPRTIKTDFKYRFFWTLHVIVSFDYVIISDKKHIDRDTTSLTQQKNFVSCTLRSMTMTFQWLHQA